MIILGIDPGTRITGYGVIKYSSSKTTALDFGAVRPPLKIENSKRYLIIFEGIESLIKKYCPNVVVVESQFVHKNPLNAITLGMAKGMAILAAERAGIPIAEYTPKKAKKAVVGHGSATKQQVQKMIQVHLNLSQLPTPEDAADALALALCHTHSLSLAHV